MTHQFQYVVLFFHFKRVLLELAERGILAAPLKGAHLLTSVYPEGEERGKISDVDFLVREEDWREVLAAMEELGFERRTSRVEETATQEVGFKLPVGADGHILFEAHRRLFDGRRLNVDHRGIWERSVLSSFDGAPCRRLAPEDGFCHGAFHELIHRLQTMGRTTRDLELLAKSGDDRFFERVVERAREWRVTRAVWLFLDLLAREKGMTQAGRAAAKIAPPIPVRSLVHRLVPSSSGTVLTPLHHRLQAAVLWPLLMDSLPQTARFAVNHPLVNHILG